MAASSNVIVRLRIQTPLEPNIAVTTSVGDEQLGNEDDLFNYIESLSRFPNNHHVDRQAGLRTESGGEKLSNVLQLLDHTWQEDGKVILFLSAVPDVCGTEQAMSKQSADVGVNDGSTSSKVIGKRPSQEGAPSKIHRRPEPDVSNAPSPSTQPAMEKPDSHSELPPGSPIHAGRESVKEARIALPAARLSPHIHGTGVKTSNASFVLGKNLLGRPGSMRDRAQQHTIDDFSRQVNELAISPTEDAGRSTDAMSNNPGSIGPFQSPQQWAGPSADGRIGSQQMTSVPAYQGQPENRASIGDRQAGHRTNSGRMEPTVSISTGPGAIFGGQLGIDKPLLGARGLQQTTEQAGHNRGSRGGRGRGTDDRGGNGDYNAGLGDNNVLDRNFVSTHGGDGGVGYGRHGNGQIRGRGLGEVVLVRNLGRACVIRQRLWRK